MSENTKPAANAFDLLLPKIQTVLKEEKYLEPTPIQSQAIPFLLEGRDLLGCAQTGTGKTAAFTLPILQHLIKNKKKVKPGEPRALILAPTRELAAQIGNSVSTYGRGLNLNHAVIFGGVKQGPQVSRLQKGADIVIATPGRLLDLREQKHISLKAVEIFVLDEADRMLDMGFIKDIRKIVSALPKERQSLFFSATMTDLALRLSQSILDNPERISITPKQLTVEKIVQTVYFVDRVQKDKLLHSMLKDSKHNRVIIFINMKHTADKVVKELRKVGIQANSIHGDKTQGARTQALSGFKNGKIQALVATDIAARGIDIDGITHVINYELPNDAETYVHRIGRTARAGAEGDAVSFCSAEERELLRQIEAFIGQDIPVEENHAFHSTRAQKSLGIAAKVRMSGNKGPNSNKPYIPKQRSFGPAKRSRKSLFFR